MANLSFIKDQLAVGYSLAASAQMAVLSPEQASKAQDIQNGIQLAQQFLETNLRSDPRRGEHEARKAERLQRMGRNYQMYGHGRSSLYANASSNMKGRLGSMHRANQAARFRWMSNESLFQRNLRRALNGDPVRGEHASDPRMKQAMRIGRIAKNIRYVENFNSWTRIPGGFSRGSGTSVSGALVDKFGSKIAMRGLTKYGPSAIMKSGGVTSKLLKTK